MPSGLPNEEKAAVRELFAEGKATREELLDAEIAAYHSKGTCTFYGTANLNQCPPSFARHGPCDDHAKKRSQWFNLHQVICNLANPA